MFNKWWKFQVSKVKFFFLILTKWLYVNLILSKNVVIYIYHYLFSACYQENIAQNWFNAESGECVPKLIILVIYS